MSRKKILVTGGAGFIGSWLCRRLINENNNVVCVDDLSTGKKDTILDLIGSPAFEFIHHDICDPLVLDIDEIYNLACQASPVYYQADPIKTTKTNVIGALNMLELAKANHASILQASTSEVYGDVLIHPQPESYWGNVNPIGIRSCYDEGKRCAESLFFDFYRKHELQIKVIRIFNTYGPAMHPHDGRAVSNFIVQALRNEEITLYGNGEQTRSFCYVDDIINGITAMMRSRDVFTGPVNLGNPEEITIRELAEKIVTMTNSRSSVRLCPLPQDDPIRRKPDITLAKDQLQWSPTITLHDGLAKTIEYFKRIL